MADRCRPAHGRRHVSTTIAVDCHFAARFPPRHRHQRAVDWISQLPFARHTPPSRSHTACRRETGNALESEDEKPAQPKHTARMARTRTIVLLFTRVAPSPRWTPENRPVVDGAKPASGRAAPSTSVL